MSTNTRLTLIIATLLVLLTVGAFWRVLFCDFTNYDDPEYVVKNMHVQTGLSPAGVSWAFKAVYQSTWQPMVWLSYMLDWQVYRLSALGFHLTNLILHVACVLLLFLTLSRATGSPWKSALVAGLFAVHPTRIESVAWVAERKDVLSTLFWMLAMLAYVRYTQARSIGRYAVVLVCYILGLMAKPMLVTLPFVLLLLDYWPLGRTTLRVGARSSTSTSKSTSKSKSVILEKLPLFAIALFFSGLAYYAQTLGGAVSTLEGVRLGARIGNALISYVEYVWKMLWPRDLAVIYPHPGNAVPALPAAGALLLLAIVTFLVLRSHKSHPYLCFGWLWYLGTLVPVIGVVQIGSHAMADRFGYVPLIGIFIIIAWGIPGLVRGGKEERRKGGREGWTRQGSSFPPFPPSPLLPFSACVALLALAACAWVQVGYWRDSMTLFSRALAITSRNYVAHLNLGTALADRKEYKTAIPHYMAALDIQPDQPSVHFNLANALFADGDIKGAIEHYEDALRLAPEFPDAAFNLEAARARLRAPQTAPRPVMRSAKREAAVKHCEEAFRLETQGDLDAATREYREAIRLDPGFAEAHGNLGVALKDQGKTDEAIHEYREAIRLKPDFAEAHGNLAVALYYKGRYAEAWEEVCLCRNYGTEPHPDFIRALSGKMPEP